MNSYPKIITIILITLTLFANLLCLQEEKVDHKSKNEFENTDYEETTLYQLDPTTKKIITAICKLSKKRLAIAHNDGDVMILGINSAKKEKIINLQENIIKLLEIPGDRLVAVSCEKIRGRAGKETIIKIWDLNHLSFKKLKKITVNSIGYIPDEPKNIFYLKENKLIFTLWKTLIVDLNLGSTTSLPFDIVYAKQDAQGNIICNCYDKEIRVLNSDFQQLQLIKTPKRLTFPHLQMLDDKQSCIISDNNRIKQYAYIVTNEKFKFNEIRKNLDNKISVIDLQKIILDYLGDIWQSEELIENNELDQSSYLDAFKIISDNKIINNQQKMDIQLWTLFPLKFIKMISKDKVYINVVIFKDGTIIVNYCNSIYAFEPVTCV